MQFSELGLCAEVLRAVEEQGYTEPTPIQEQAIPPVLLGRDVLARAQTGTGKTAAFTLPMLQRLKSYANTSVSPARHPVRALIVAPTRELAAQVWESARTYGTHIPLRSAVVYGGVSIDPQIKELQAGVEILVATPGRLLDHVHQRTVNLGTAQILVLDEADRMLDMGFLPDIRRILGLLPPQRQNLMFSATFPDDIRRLADQILRDPVRIQVTPRNSVTELVTHLAYRVETRGKREFLERLVRAREMRQVLVFTTTKLSANRLARQLERDGFVCAALHSDRTQAERTQALNAFKEGDLQLLVATDIAARGLDIELLPHVVNYEMPHNPEDYIHRIGRTGRAGITGEAISLVAREELDSLADVERLIRVKIPVQPASSLEAMRSQQPAREITTAAMRSQQPAREVTMAATRPESESGALLAGGGAAPAGAKAAAPAPAAGKKGREVAALLLPPIPEKQN